MTEQKHNVPTDKCTEAGRILEEAILHAIGPSTAIPKETARQMLEAARNLLDQGREEGGGLHFSQDERLAIYMALERACSAYPGDTPEREFIRKTITDLADMFR